jgi:hypothetical protein
MSRLFRICLLALATLVAQGCEKSSEHSLEEVRGAVAAANLEGQQPDTVIARLRAIRLARGDTLRVGRFIEDGDRRVVEAAVWDAFRTTVTWNVNIFVLFDSTRRATKVEVEASTTAP